MELGDIVKATLIAMGVVACARDPRPLPKVPESAADAPGQAGDASDGPRWSYDGPTGPSHWAELKPEWKACADAGQSPVDLPLEALTSSPEEAAKPDAASQSGAAPSSAAPKNVQVSLGDLRMEATSDGRVVKLAGARDQLLAVDGRSAELTHVEIHSPSEHRLGGVTLDAELVFWFKGSGGRFALSTLYRSGQASKGLAPLVDNLPPQGNYTKTSLGADLPLSQLIPPGQKILVYAGSETVPPCASVARRLVLAWVGELSNEQLVALRAATGTNARPPQPLGDRVVTAVPLVVSVSKPIEPETAGAP